MIKLKRRKRKEEQEVQCLQIKHAPVGSGAQKFTQKNEKLDMIVSLAEHKRKDEEEFEVEILVMRKRNTQYSWFVQKAEEKKNEDAHSALKHKVWVVFNDSNQTFPS